GPRQTGAAAASRAASVRTGCDRAAGTRGITRSRAWRPRATSARHLRRLRAPIPAAAPEISELRPAHGGPSYFRAKRAPFRGATEVMEATLYGQESVAAVRFELVDDAGRVVQEVPA